ncbi:ABC transporter permease subunit [Bradyrhizobium sp. SSUT18]|nr:ABC transporter permease subunit [Bradyrhizobium sp. SSUT18]MDH2401801.1 ABC transporter permease subunit [Bradyrhizobium sp. SSUT18]
MSLIWKRRCCPRHDAYRHRDLATRVEVRSTTSSTIAIPVSANVAEVVRGAILSVPKGQWESSESLGFSRWQTLSMIILPQCIKRMMAPWMNTYAILVLSTPIAAVLGVHEAVGNAQQAMEALGARTSLLVPFYSFILLLFFFFIYPISRLTLWLERKYAVYA